VWLLVQDVNAQHLFFLLSGLLVGYWVVGPGVGHSITTILVTYLILLVGNQIIVNFFVCSPCFRSLSFRVLQFRYRYRTVFLSLLFTVFFLLVCFYVIPILMSLQSC
jgi:hypothetical protein